MSESATSRETESGETPEDARFTVPEEAAFDARFRAHIGEVGMREAEDELSLLHGSSVGPSKRDTRRRRALALADVLSLLASFGAMQVLARPGAVLEDQRVLLLSLPLWILLNKLLGLYDRDTILLDKSTLNELPAVAQSIALGSTLVYLFAPELLGGAVGRREILVFWFAAVVLTPLLRWLARTYIRRGLAPERCVIVGSGIVAGMIARKLRAHAEYGADPVGYVEGPEANMVGDLPKLGPVEDFERVCEEVGAERVIVAFSRLSHGHLLDVIRISTRRGMKISIVPRLFEVVGRGVEVDQIEGLALMGLRGATRTKTSLALKRAIDVLGAAAGLLVTAPLLVLVAAAIKVTSAGPVLYAQRRVGRGSQEFRILKFRTMVQDADAMKADLEHLNELAPMFKLVDDPRVTRVGRLLRRSSLDELPQLWNVLRGEMSLVGPRPLVPSESALVLGWHRARLDLTPGLTGPWQVLGRNTIPFDEMVKLDYLYVADWSLWNDIKLMVRTLPVVLRRAGH